MKVLFSQDSIILEPEVQSDVDFIESVSRQEMLATGVVAVADGLKSRLVVPFLMRYNPVESSPILFVTKYKDYLGDSVYADHNGSVVLLTTNNGFGDKNPIYLEPEVLRALVRYAKRFNLLADEEESGTSLTEAETRRLLIEFLDDVRNYMRESNNNIGFDERTSEEFVDTFLSERR